MDPVTFAREVLGVELWQEQQRLVERLSSPNFRLATPLELYLAEKAAAARMWRKLVHLLYPEAIVTYGRGGREVHLVAKTSPPPRERASRRADRVIKPSRRPPGGQYIKKDPRR